MKVLTGKAMAELDRIAIDEIGIPRLVLMENAGRSVFQIIQERVSEFAQKKIVIVCGKGNNGGDGLVVARHLMNAGASPQIFVLSLKEELSPDARVNAEIFERSEVSVRYLDDDAQLSELAQVLAHAELVVDAIFGTGFEGAARGLSAQAIELINVSPARVFSIDIPSGVEGDTGYVLGPAVLADVTVTLQLPKLGLFLYPGRGYVGELAIGTVGYPRSLVENFPSSYELVEECCVREHLPERKPDGHKGDFGRVLVIAGSRGMTGAATLAAESALRAGAGLVYLAYPESLSSVIEIKLTEVVKLSLPDSNGALTARSLSAIEQALTHKTVVALGPGLSQSSQIAKLLTELLPQLKIPIVLDADGINNLKNSSVLSKKRLKAPLVLTPHAGELARLLGKTREDIEADRIGIAQQVATELGATLVLKGAPTVTALANGKVFINSSGNSGLATGGSGDVLTGLIVGLIAQGAKPEDAAVAGVYLHGRIADELKTKLGERGMIAGDLVRHLPKVMKEFEC
ncbi:NAD(P)H-hydrate dehydratase [Candidatus Acetothermia bacterium]|nr:NAD(P)H-hydrate dehydratase [Candidatus Acetothermia bacterium]